MISHVTVGNGRNDDYSIFDSVSMGYVGEESMTEETVGGMIVLLFVAFFLLISAVLFIGPDIVQYIIYLILHKLNLIP